MLLRRETSASIQICNRSPHARRFIIEALNGQPVTPPLGFDFESDQERTITFSVRQESLDYKTRPPGDTFWFNVTGHWIRSIAEPPAEDANTA